MHYRGSRKDEIDLTTGNAIQFLLVSLSNPDIQSFHSLSMYMYMYMDV